jgi:hypothetical protein
VCRPTCRTRVQTHDLAKRLNNIAKLVWISNAPTLSIVMQLPTLGLHHQLVSRKPRHKKEISRTDGVGVDLHREHGPVWDDSHASLPGQPAPKYSCSDDAGQTRGEKSESPIRKHRNVDRLQNTCAPMTHRRNGPGFTGAGPVSLVKKKGKMDRFLKLCRLKPAGGLGFFLPKVGQKNKRWTENVEKIVSHLLNIYNNIIYK